MSLFDLERMDKELFKVFSQLQELANKKRMLDKHSRGDPESRQREVNALRTSVSLNC